MEWIKCSEKLPILNEIKRFNNFTKEDIQSDFKSDHILILLKEGKQLTGWYNKSNEDEEEDYNKPWRVFSCGCCYPEAYKPDEVEYWCELPLPPSQK